MLTPCQQGNLQRQQLVGYPGGTPQGWDQEHHRPAGGSPGPPSPCSLLLPSLGRRVDQKWGAGASPGPADGVTPSWACPVAIAPPISCQVPFNWRRKQVRRAEPTALSCPGPAAAEQPAVIYEPRLSRRPLPATDPSCHSTLCPHPAWAPPASFPRRATKAPAPQRGSHKVQAWGQGHIHSRAAVSTPSCLTWPLHHLTRDPGKPQGWPGLRSGSGAGPTHRRALPFQRCRHQRQRRGFGLAHTRPGLHPGIPSGPH